MTTDPVGGAQPGGVLSLPGSEAGIRPAEVEFRDLRYFAVSDRLLEQLAEGRLHAAVVHRVPTLPSTDGIMSEALRRGRLAVLVGQPSRLAGQPIVTLGELSKETFLVNPRSLTRAPTRASSSCAVSSVGSRPPSWNPPSPRRSPSTPTGGPSGTAPPSR